jgi:hypothetical protein
MIATLPLNEGETEENLRRPGEKRPARAQGGAVPLVEEGLAADVPTTAKDGPTLQREVNPPERFSA